MANYFEMNRDELVAEKAKLEEQYKNFQAMGLKLNMARGKPGPHQMDLAMGLLQMTDYTTDAGTDARNYGDLEGLHEARVLFADVFGVKPAEVFVGGNSSLQLMYNLINRRKHRDRKRIWNRRLNQFHVKNRQMKRRKQEPDKYSIRDGKQETLKGIVYLSIQSCYA